MREDDILNNEAYTARTDIYTQSANSLFHFMKQPEFLINSLKKKALFPRYCVEKIDYLNLSSSEALFSEIAILDKCFCDIFLHW